MSDRLLAHECPEGHLTIPGHHRCPVCGKDQAETIDLTEATGEVVTWTTSTATPPGVRSPNHLAIIEFDVDNRIVRTIGQLTTEDVETGDTVIPVYVGECREPGAGIREAASQSWSGFRFEPE